MAASGQKLRFYDVRGDGHRLQVMANLADHDLSTGDFLEVHNAFRRGDIVGKGEQCLFPSCHACWEGKAVIVML